MTTEFKKIEGPLPEYGVNVILLGEMSSGKTHALRTLWEAGLEVFVISTEPGIEEVLGDLPKETFHWHYLPPSAATFNDLIDSAVKINANDYEGLTRLKGINKNKYREYIELLETCNDFVCDRTGESYGSIKGFDSTRAVAIDSLTGMSIMAMNLMVGSKPMKHQGEYGVAMDNLHKTFHTLTGTTKCHFILTAHPEREKNEVTGAVNVMVSTLGSKLAPQIPKLFSDVIYLQRREKEFYWSTTAPGVELKARNLDFVKDMPPTFLPLIQNWKDKIKQQG